MLTGNERCEDGLVCLRSSEDLTRFLNDLDVSGDDLSLLVQFTPYCLLKGILENVHVYVNSWPNWSIVFCGHDSAECLPEKSDDRLELLYCTLYVRKGSQLSTTALKGFLGQVFTELRIFERGADFVGLTPYLRRSLREFIREVAPPNLSLDDMSPLGDPHHVVGYKHDLSGLEEHIMSKLVDGHTIGRLKSEDIPVVMEAWPPAAIIPNCQQRLSWLVSKFPSGCIRDRYGVPIAWCLTYQYGAVGAKYTVPQHRSKGYGRLVVFYTLKRFNELYPSMRLYAIVAKTNEAQFRSDAILTQSKSEDCVSIIFFKPTEV